MITILFSSGMTSKRTPINNGWIFLSTSPQDFQCDIAIVVCWPVVYVPGFNAKTCWTVEYNRQVSLFVFAEVLMSFPRTNDVIRVVLINALRLAVALESRWSVIALLAVFPPKFSFPLPWTSLTPYQKSPSSVQNAPSIVCFKMSLSLSRPTS